MSDPRTAFNWRNQPSEISWKKANWMQLVSHASSDTIERKRADGTDKSSINGLSKPADQLIADFQARDAIKKARESAILKERQQFTYSRAKPSAKSKKPQ